MGNLVAEACLTENNLYNSLVDCGIMYHRKYYAFSVLHKKLYLNFVKEYLDEKKSN